MKVHVFAHKVCRYVRKSDDAALLIYNTTDYDPDLVVSIDNAEYAQDVRYQHEGEYKPQAGDYVFRLLDARERNEIARMIAKRWWKKNHRTAKVGFKQIVRLHEERLRRKPVVFRLQEKA